MRIYAKIFCKGYDYRSNYLKKFGIVGTVEQSLLPLHQLSILDKTITSFRQVANHGLTHFRQLLLIRFGLRHIPLLTRILDQVEQLLLTRVHEPDILDLSAGQGTPVTHPRFGNGGILIQIDIPLRRVVRTMRTGKGDLQEERIPQVAQHLRHLIRIFPGNPTVAQHAMVPWRHTGQEAGTGRRTAGGRSITTGEEGSLLGQLVDVGRDDRLIPHAM